MFSGISSTKNSNHRIKKQGGHIAWWILTAISFLIIGILISSGLDFTSKTTAQIPANIGQTGTFPIVERDGDYESPFVRVVERVADAVVNISARSQEQITPWWYHGANYSTSSGSGFFFREDGYILTNNHVVEDAVEYFVTTASGYRYDAVLVGADPQTDLAVLKINPEEELKTIPFGDSDEIKVGDWAIAIGNPFPQQGLDRTVTVGVISAKGRSNLNFGRETPTFQDYIQTDASINPGNSGGPLLNLRGECIGVNAAISSPTGGSVGIGFAIPINLGRSVVIDLITSGEVKRGWLGVWLGRLTEEEARRQGLEGVKGVKIDSVFTNSPADKAGIKNGDIILRVNGNEVNNNNQLSVQISQAREGQPVPMEVVREGEHFDVHPVIGDRETFLTELSDEESSDDFISARWMGMDLITFTNDVANALNIEHVDGVYVRRVNPGSPADNASINRGSIILQIYNETVSSIEDIEQISADLPRSTKRISLIVVEPDGTIARKVIRP